MNQKYAVCPYEQCSLCFLSLSGIVSHYKSCVGYTPPQDYSKCDYCEARFIHFTHCQTHKIRIHKHLCSVARLSTPVHTPVHQTPPHTPDMVPRYMGQEGRGGLVTPVQSPGAGTVVTPPLDQGRVVGHRVNTFTENSSTHAVQARGIVLCSPSHCAGLIVCFSMKV